MHVHISTQVKTAELGLICAVVIINVSIGLIQEGKAQAAADAIKNMLSPSAQVIRDNGQQQVIDSVSARAPPG
jgi:magnesium-transporting ATPase (P-type)